MYRVPWVWETKK